MVCIIFANTEWSKITLTIESASSLWNLPLLHVFINSSERSVFLHLWIYAPVFMITDQWLICIWIVWVDNTRFSINKISIKLIRVTPTLQRRCVNYAKTLIMKGNNLTPKQRTIVKYKVELSDVPGRILRIILWYIGCSLHFRSRTTRLCCWRWADRFMRFCGWWDDHRLLTLICRPNWITIGCVAYVASEMFVRRRLCGVSG